MTITEYELLMKGVRLREFDKDYRQHMQAYLNLSVQAKRKVGRNKEKYVYSNFTKFFDYKKREQEARNIKSEPKFKGIGKILQ